MYEYLTSVWVQSNPASVLHRH